VFMIKRWPPTRSQALAGATGPFCCRSWGRFGLRVAAEQKTDISLNLAVWFAAQRLLDGRIDYIHMLLPGRGTLGNRALTALRAAIQQSNAVPSQTLGRMSSGQASKARSTLFV